MREKHYFNFSVPSLLLLNDLDTCFLDAIRYLLKYFSSTKSSRKVQSSAYFAFMVGSFLFVCLG